MDKLTALKEDTKHTYTLAPSSEAAVRGRCVCVCTNEESVEYCVL